MGLGAGNALIKIKQTKIAALVEFTFWWRKWTLNKMDQ